jgi:hypothetical protein
MKARTGNEHRATRRVSLDHELSARLPIREGREPLVEIRKLSAPLIDRKVREELTLHIGKAKAKPGAEIGIEGGHYCGAPTKEEERVPIG